MGTEIERKFLVHQTTFLNTLQGQTIQQGYIHISDESVTRVRRIGDEGFLTIKSKNDGIRRMEFEYPIPVEDATEMLESLCDQLISKTRYSLEVDGLEWVVDVFDGLNEGLVLAEVELEHETQSFTKPDWTGEEVSDDVRYYNSRLSTEPYSTWKR